MMNKQKEIYPESPPHDAALAELARLAPEHQRILCEIGRMLNSIRYGSIVLTIHEGRLVEFSETVRHRTRGAS